MTLPGDLLTYLEVTTWVPKYIPQLYPGQSVS